MTVRIVGDEEARRAAVAALSGGDGGARACWSRRSGDDSWRVRKEAALRAASWADPTGDRELMETLAEPENLGRRNAAVEALVRLGARRAFPRCSRRSRRAPSTAS